MIDTLSSPDTWSMFATNDAMRLVLSLLLIVLLAVLIILLLLGCAALVRYLQQGPAAAPRIVRAAAPRKPVRRKKTVRRA